ncbi:transmembrane di-heme cytochrome [Glonium stellatum]|uniref:Cytochrome b n=1 Tax=Glonium stellatum TaxID=574774 RepID=A0A8E2F7R3_9PEZI|nr:transmembrane di-heme cytochrome [Glonium stellatum]
MMATGFLGYVLPYGQIFFSLHFVLPFILAALALMHLIALHDSAGSGNPLGVSGNYDRLPFAPYFIFKDLITIFLFIIVLSIFVFFMPNVLGDSVIAMFSAILILLVMPFTDLSRSRGIQFRPLSKIAFYFFVANFLILMQLGAKHVESPFIEFGQISTIIYFSYFLVIVPATSLLENSLIELAINKNK